MVSNYSVFRSLLEVMFDILFSETRSVRYSYGILHFSFNVKFRFVIFLCFSSMVYRLITFTKLQSNFVLYLSYYYQNNVYFAVSVLCD